MKWLSVNLGNGAQAITPRIKIQEKYFAYLLAHGDSKEFVIFASSPLKTDGNVILYFPPEFATFAHSIGATQECDQPERNLVGIEAACDAQESLDFYYQNKDMQ